MWRTGFNVSGFEADKGAASISANIVYSPAPGILMGVEYMHASREDGTDGDFDRLQFSAKCSFGYTSTTSVV